MNSLNFDSLCLIAENIEDAIKLLEQNNFGIKNGDITVHINADDEAIMSLDNELNEIYNITEHNNEVDGVVCEILGMKFIISNENQSE